MDENTVPATTRRSCRQLPWKDTLYSSDRALHATSVSTRSSTGCAATTPGSGTPHTATELCARPRSRWKVDGVVASLVTEEEQVDGQARQAAVQMWSWRRSGWLYAAIDSAVSRSS